MRQPKITVWAPKFDLYINPLKPEVVINSLPSRQPPTSSLFPNPLSSYLFFFIMCGIFAYCNFLKEKVSYLFTVSDLCAFLSAAIYTLCIRVARTQHVFVNGNTTSLLIRVLKR